MDDDDVLDPPRYMALPVLGDPDPADPTQTLPAVRERRVFAPYSLWKVMRDCAIIELEEDPLTRSAPRGDDVPWVFIFKPTNTAAPGDNVVVLYEHKLAVRRYEPQDDEEVCLRSAEPKCPTWILPAGEVNLQGVVIRRGPADIMDVDDGYYPSLTLPVLGDPDPADPTQALPVVRERRVDLGKVARDDRFAIIELEEDPLTGSTSWGDAEPWGRMVFIFKQTKEAAPGDAVVVLHEHKLAVRRYEPQDDGEVCLRSAEPKCPTWVLPADEVNLQGVVIRCYERYFDSGWA